MPWPEGPGRKPSSAARGPEERNNRHGPLICLTRAWQGLALCLMSQHPHSHLQKTLHIPDTVLTVFHGSAHWIFRAITDIVTVTIPTIQMRKLSLGKLDTCPKVTHPGNGGTWCCQASNCVASGLRAQHLSQSVECSPISTKDDLGWDINTSLLLNPGVRFFC